MFLFIERQRERERESEGAKQIQLFVKMSNEINHHFKFV